LDQVEASKAVVLRGDYGGDGIADVPDVIEQRACSSWLTGRMPYSMGDMFAGQDKVDAGVGGAREMSILECARAGAGNAGVAVGHGGEGKCRRRSGFGR